MKNNTIKLILALATSVLLISATYISEKGSIGSDSAVSQEGAEVSSEEADQDSNQEYVIDSITGQKIYVSRAADGALSLYLPSHFLEEDLYFIENNLTTDLKDINIMYADSLSSLYIISDKPNKKGRKWVESDNENRNVASGKILMVDSYGDITSEASLEKIRLRGNFTASAHKKPYQIKLEKSTDLLSIGQKTKKYALLANAYDQSLINNELSYNMATYLGINGATDCKSVNLYYDGEYRGVYLICETVDIDKNSVVVPSGSALLELDHTHYLEQETYTILSNGTPIALKSPTEVSTAYMNKIVRVWENIIACSENGGTHPTTGLDISEYLDLDSYAIVYLMHELSKNPDGFCSSTYCYIPIDEEKLYFCAPWDFDLSYGIYVVLEDLLYTDGLYPDNFGSHLADLPSVNEAVRKLYTDEFRNMITDIVLSEDITDVESNESPLRSINTYYNELKSSQAMEYSLFADADKGMTLHYDTYEGSVDHLKRFITERIAWFDSIYID